MTVVKKLPLYYEGLAADSKPTGVRPGATFRETDTNRMWITYDGTTWIVVDKRVRLVTEDGTFGFGGNVYSKTMTMSDNDATRFETTTKKLRDVIIKVTTQNMLVGETGVEVYPVGAGEIIGFTKVDISTLYFKNASAGSDGTITILGVEM